MGLVPVQRHHVCPLGIRVRRLIAYMDQHLNSFWAGDIVSIGEVPEYQNVKVERISLGGVWVNTSKGLCVLAGGTPARLVRRGSYIAPVYKPIVVVPEVRAPVTYKTIPLHDLSAALKPNAHDLSAAAS